MNKIIKLEDNKLHVVYDFTDMHLKTLTVILDNDGCVEFENRKPDILEDIDGNELSWKICDELVEMGLLNEDEESYDIFYEINDAGKNIIAHYVEL